MQKEEDKDNQIFFSYHSDSNIEIFSLILVNNIYHEDLDININIKNEK